MDAEETQMEALINQYRTDHGLNALTIEPHLDQAATGMSTDMGAKNYFDHTDSYGRSSDQRIKDFGYTYVTSTGENLASGEATAANTFAQWKASPHHNENMLSPLWTVMGIARVNTPGSQYGWYWTNDFGGYDPAAGLAVPAITNPPDGATLTTGDPSSTFNWSSVAGATQYEQQIATDNLFTGTSTVYDQLTSAGVTPTLTFGSTYYWRLRAGNGAIWSDWTTPRSFTVAP